MTFLTIGLSGTTRCVNPFANGTDNARDRNIFCTTAQPIPAARSTQALQQTLTLQSTGQLFEVSRGYLLTLCNFLHADRGPLFSPAPQRIMQCNVSIAVTAYLPLVVKRIFLPTAS